MTDPQALELQSLSDALWEERHEIEALLARVVALRLVLQAGEHRFVSACLDEVESSMTELGGRSSMREGALAAVAEHPPTLAGLAADAPSPLAWAFAEHRATLIDLLADLDREVVATRRLARTARAETLAALRIARQQGAHPSMDAFDGVMELELRAQACRGVLLALRDLAPPGLRAFVTAPD